MFAHHVYMFLDGGSPLILDPWAGPYYSIYKSGLAPPKKQKEKKKKTNPHKKQKIKTSNNNQKQTQTNNKQASCEFEER